MREVISRYFGHAQTLLERSAGTEGVFGHATFEYNVLIYMPNQHANIGKRLVQSTLLHNSLRRAQQFGTGRDDNRACRGPDDAGCCCRTHRDNAISGGPQARLGRDLQQNLFRKQESQREGGGRVAEGSGWIRRH